MRIFIFLILSIISSCSEIKHDYNDNFIPADSLISLLDSMEVKDSLKIDSMICEIDSINISLDSIIKSANKINKTSIKPIILNKEVPKPIIIKDTIKLEIKVPKEIILCDTIILRDTITLSKKDLRKINRNVLPIDK